MILDDPSIVKVFEELDHLLQNIYSTEQTKYRKRNIDETKLCGVAISNGTCKRYKNKGEKYCSWHGHRVDAVVNDTHNDIEYAFEEAMKNPIQTPAIMAISNKK